MNNFRYITYDKFGVVSYYSFKFVAVLKALYQSFVLGVDSFVDVECVFRDHVSKRNCLGTRTVCFFAGWKPFLKYR